MKVERIVPYQPIEMFDLVSDVERYPSFIPWVRSLVCERSPISGRSWAGVATATVGFKGFTEQFTTRVETGDKDLSIEVTLVKGPFRRLNNSWRFYSHPQGCRVAFTIDYEFRNPILNALAKMNTVLASNRIMAAFLNEAGRRYTAVRPISGSPSELPA
jgi:coenzyme Q-binding protein COQ10